MAEPSPVPTNIVTGFLGVGKTTAVLGLLHRRPAGSRWAVLVNEFGDVSVDGPHLDGAGLDGVAVRDIAGGCICCTAGPLRVQVALHFLLQEVRPDRLLIETSGAAHPGRLLEMFRQPLYAGQLDLRATVCLLDPRDLADPSVTASEVFRDQVQLADVLVLNKSDVAGPSQPADFLAMAAGLFPPKERAVVTEQGRLDPAWLDLPAGRRPPLFADAHPPAHGHGHDPEPLPVPPPGRPVRRRTDALGVSACGWLFSPADRFDEDRLLMLAAGAEGVRRLKGVFRLADDDRVLINRTAGEVTVTPTGYDRDSRVEVFAPFAADDWDHFERRLLECLAEE